MLQPHQNARIELIKSILPYFGDKFVLKGGTALSLYYDLDRYSEDLDFDCKSNNMNFINRLKVHKDFKNWHLNIKKDTNTTFRAMLDYGALSPLGQYPLKIEVSIRNKILLQQGSLKYKNIKGVNVYDINELILMKVSAFSGRDKIRDFYDLGFLLEKYPKYFSAESLKAIHQKISYAGDNELNLLLKDEIDKHNLIPTNNMRDLNNYSQITLKNIEKLLDSNEIINFGGNSNGKR